MSTAFTVADPSQIPSPALLFSLEAIRHNIFRMIQRAGGPERLRPHVKTHKTRQIVRMQRDAGVVKHKAATIAEAEMLAQEAVSEVLLAYPLVGPAARRFAKLVRTYPECRFLTTVDHPDLAEGLSQALVNENVAVEVLLDVDVGQHRTGLPVGEAAFSLYGKIHQYPGLTLGGLHVYDGHNHQSSIGDREAAALPPFERVLEFRDRLLDAGLPVPRIVLGGTPTFPVYSKVTLPGVELSPGTCVLSDHGYGTKYLDMGDFSPAALVLTRVISKPTATRLTLDMGHKSVAGDPPMGKRARIMEIDDAEQVLHNEEHLVIETPQAASFRLGDVLYAMPTHICPTCALHQEAIVIENGAVVDVWPIAARDRRLTI
jgi:D-serine deaminase-like pyridoxal phosphate-dependent protein